MGADLLRMYVSTSMMVCYRSVAKHPFLVGMIIVLYSMYRLFPLMFSLLVSASPVVVSTAFLLGTLLSYGQPNIPEIETETKKESDVDEVRKSETKFTSVSEVTIGRDEGLIEVADRSLDGTNTFVESDNKVVDSVDNGELQFGEERLVEDEKTERDNDNVVLGSRYSPLQQSESDDKLWEGSPDPLNTNAGLLWKHMEGDHRDDDDGDDDDDDGDDDGDDDDDDDDDDSDLAESSSPDASMADIIPMLDELHPLLSEERETREVPQMSRDDVTDDDINALSEHSHESSVTSSESNDDNDDDGGGDDGDGIEKREDLEDGKDKESKHVEKEYETRSAILWTEYDQKNLMNLGTSEMERNRRLENLIARRRARKTMRMQAEKNLIDLESVDIPWNIPPISTARINPFDYDTSDNIPGSAPSVLLKRRNPFDLPYDSSEEKPDLVGDTFQQEFAPIVQPKEAIFRRHESFNVGPSSFGASRSERQESRLKPYFVPERSFAEFQRQFSGLSDSKTSSVPDTESDFESKDHIEEDEEMVSEKDHENVSRRRPYFVPEHLVSDQTSFSSFQRQLSEISESKVSSVPDTESVSSASDDEIKDHNEDEHLFEDDAEVESVQVSKEDEGVDNENELNFVSANNQQEISSDSDNEAVIQLNSGDVELHSRKLSLSSTDEVSEQVYNDKQEDDEAEVAMLVPETTYFVDRSNSIERSDTDVTSLLVEENHPNEPIYDLSPRSVTRNLSSNSILNDLHNDHSENQHELSSSVADVKLNSTDSGFETADAHNQLSSVLHDEEPLSTSDNIMTDVQLDTDASHYQLEHVQVSSSSCHEDINQEENHEELLQGDQLNEGLVASSNSKIVHEETQETLHQFVSEKEVLLDTSINKSEENSHVLQVENTCNNLDNLQITEPDNIVLHNINSASSIESEVVEVIDTETRAPGNTAYASDSHNGIESTNVTDDIDIDDDDDVDDDDDEIKEIDEDLLVELDAVGDFSIKNSGSDFNETKEDKSLELEHDHETKATAEDLESVLDEIKQEPNDLEINDSVDEDSTYSKDLGSTLSDVKRDPQASDHDLETKDHVLNEIKHDTVASDHDLKSNRSIDEDSDSKDIGSTLNEMQRDPHVSDHDLETLDEIEHDPHHSKHDHLETNGSVDDDSDSKDLESTFTEMRRDPQSTDHHHRLETFYSVDENFVSKHVESSLNETKHDVQRDFEATRSDDELDNEVKKSHNNNEVSNVEDAGLLEDEESKIKLINDTSEVLLPQETESSTSLTIVDHGAEDALTMDKA